MKILAIDPGTSKCGVAVLDDTGKVLLREIVRTNAMSARLQILLHQWEIPHAVYGLSTNANYIKQLLKEASKSTFVLEIHGIDERNSTLEARPLYWKENPRRGWRRMIPISLLEPPTAIDDYAAVVLGQRFIAGLHLDAGE